MGISLVDRLSQPRQHMIIRQGDYFWSNQGADIAETRKKMIMTTDISTRLEVVIKDIK
jgi:hypothetical protein